MTLSSVSETDRMHLARCVELAEEAVETGNRPFGSILVSGDGRVLEEDYNRTGSGDPTRHPEFALARWAADNLPADERAAATLYTSGEHCPMCATAHAWVGLGRIVFATSTKDLVAWLDEFGAKPLPYKPIGTRELLPGHPIAGPDDSFREVVKALHGRVHQH